MLLFRVLPEAGCTDFFQNIRFQAYRAHPSTIVSDKNAHDRKLKTTQLSCLISPDGFMFMTFAALSKWSSHFFPSVTVIFFRTVRCCYHHINRYSRKEFWVIPGVISYGHVTTLGFLSISIKQMLRQSHGNLSYRVLVNLIHASTHNAVQSARAEFEATIELIFYFLLICECLQLSSCLKKKELISFPVLSIQIFH